MSKFKRITEEAGMNPEDFWIKKSLKRDDDEISQDEEQQPLNFDEALF